MATPARRRIDKLRRPIAIDLKLGRLEAADKGQVELYLGGSSDALARRTRPTRWA